MGNEAGGGRFPGWLLWIIGPVTVLAAALIILAVVLGIQAGQRQVEIQQRQQIGIALQRAADYRLEGRLEDALGEYQRVLILDPNNSAAMEGIRSLALGDAPPLAEGTAPEGDAVAQEESEEPVAAAGQEEQLWTQAVSAYEAGQWQEAIDVLVQIQEVEPRFRPNQVTEMLFNGYVNLAAESDQLGDLEGALRYVDMALEINPESTQLLTARSMAADYLDMLTLYGKDWARAVSLLTGLYERDPSYRDVGSRIWQARYAYGDELIEAEDWCGAAEQYAAATEIEVAPGSILKRDNLQEQCEQAQTLALATSTATPTLAPTPGPTPTFGPTPTEGVPILLTPLPPVSDGGFRPTSTPTPLPGVVEDEAGDAVDSVVSSPDDSSDANDLSGAGTDEVAVEEPSPTAEVVVPAGAPTTGKVLYTALDPIHGRNHVYLQSVSGGLPQLLAEDGQQAAMRPDGTRFVYRSLRDDMRGIASVDPASGLVLRFTTYSEDGFSDWNGEGNRIVFASNREGDRRWRIYTLWADEGSEAQVMGFGNTPAWSPVADQIVYQGCDESGNGCGLRSMTGSGGDPRGITSVPADRQPSWSPDGSFVAFMSDGRDGNPEVYRVDMGAGSVTRLTDSGGIDGQPAVSPDSQWVAFFSNRSGVWAIWAVPSSGGEAQLIANIDGSLGNWEEQSLQWIN